MTRRTPNTPAAIAAATANDGKGRTPSRPRKEPSRGSPDRLARALRRAARTATPMLRRWVQSLFSGEAAQGAGHGQ
jgi:hypothetical protein